MSKFGFTSVTDLLGANEDSTFISIDSLISFSNHPFKVIDDADMVELVESIKENGVISPIIVRTSAHNEPKLYEIISGHRRVHAAKLAGLKEVPATIKEMTDDEAVVLMVNANMQRKELLPSERAYSLKMKYDAMKRQGKRSDLTSAHYEPKLSSEELGEAISLSAAQIKRYIKLADLISELMECLDNKEINIAIGYDLSFIDTDSQMVIYNYLQKGNKLSTKQAKTLKEYNKDGTSINEGDVEVLLEEETPKRKFKMSSKKIDKYFPKDMSEEDIENVIIELLEKWSVDNGRSRSDC